jgi:large subunit ribosomal protein L2
MAIRQYKPVTPGRRQGSVSDFAEITDRKRKPEKSLLLPKKKTGGRNNQGVTCTRFRGGGHKQKYRIIDFKRNRDGLVATVISIEYDPNRSSRIALLEYQDGEKTYILAPEGLTAGDKVMSGEDVEPKIGNCMPLKKIPLGLIIHNVELQPGHGGQVCRSAGTKATLTAREGKWAQITLPSGEVRRVSNECRATIGMIGNTDHMNVSLGKAGRARWMGRRPHNRGTSMNPVDHPMGGGEGRQSGGLPRSRKGLPAKGYKTRHPKNPSNRFILERRKK